MNTSRHHTIEITVPLEHIDALGHVNNAVYVQYIEAVAHAHAERVQMPFEKLREFEAVPMSREHHLKYVGQAKAGDVLEVQTVVQSMNGVRATRLNTVRCAGKLLVESTALWVWVNPVSNRLRKPPEPIWYAFGFDPE
ncbi:MAG: acyl-CoA thioesterase [Casimicrobium sp.]